MEANKEIWKLIVEYKNYQVSCLGRVRNATTELTLTPGIDRGYCRVALRKEGKPWRVAIHRLVATAFIINPQQKNTIDHIDGNRSNNVVENLRWVSMSENNRNRMKREGTTSSFKGVAFASTRKLWLASIKPSGKSKHLGYFTNEREAGEAYNTAALEHFGIFAKLNTFID